ncbi:hypothetical protein [uncultured Alistipes sp.]|uniref:hypothetical protein n=1 Tax=uncultured Alistipes sp. TaxID=538949 RepID=UPI0026092608|nr:hypothetical protein [uncultured Alistipes sp.]
MRYDAKVADVFHMLACSDRKDKHFRAKDRGRRRPNSRCARSTRTVPPRKSIFLTKCCRIETRARSTARTSQRETPQQKLQSNILQQITDTKNIPQKPKHEFFLPPAPSEQLQISLKYLSLHNEHTRITFHIQTLIYTR